MSDNDSSRLLNYKKTMLQVAAYRRIRGAVSGVLHHFDLNTTQWMILGILHDSSSGLKITDIARSLEVEVPLITRLAQSLRRDGLVQRKLNENDKRVRPLSLTARGKHVFDNVEQLMGEQMTAFEEPMDSQTVSSYFATLEALTKKPERGQVRRFSTEG